MVRLRAGNPISPREFLLSAVTLLVRILRTAIPEFAQARMVEGMLAQDQLLASEEHEVGEELL